MPKQMLHMHQVKEFIDDKYSFLGRYFENKDPKYYQYKGVQRAFAVGSAVDYAIKQYYINLNHRNNGHEDVNLEDGIFRSSHFTRELSRIEQTLVQSLVLAYIDKYYNEEDTREYFHSFSEETHQVNFHDFVIYTRPDMTAYTYYENQPVIIEIKTSGDAEKSYSAETLDFQTMTYVWSHFYHHNGAVPLGVIKRTLMKPRISKKKGESVPEFQKRLVEYIVKNEEKLLKSSFRETNLEMIISFERYLNEILLDLDNSLKGNNRYKFYKKSGDYWGL
jgi:hypothetical protein